VPEIDTIEDKEVLRQIARQLWQENERLHERLKELTERLAQVTGTDAEIHLKMEIERLRAYMAKLQKAAYGKSSEKRALAEPRVNSLDNLAMN
jgi:cell division septum initiation protein DivIVA